MNRLLAMTLVLSAVAISTGAKKSVKPEPTSDDPESVAALKALGARLSWSGRKVVAVDLAGNVKAHRALAHLGGLPHLARLSLRGADIANNDLARLEQLSTLKKLDLGGTKITSAGASHLAGLLGLTALDLSGTHVDDAALAHLEGLIRLVSLNVNGTRVTRAALNQLKLSGKLPKLDVLNACNCRTNDKLGTSLTWAESVEDASQAAAASDKLLFVLHVSGDFRLPEFT